MSKYIYIFENFENIHLGISGKRFRKGLCRKVGVWVHIQVDPNLAPLVNE